MAVKILHLSDIHFCCPKNDGFDIDEDLRSELEIDLQTLVEKFGKIDLILIGGDIAFSGKKEEFEKADAWLKKITEIVHCPNENILTVPGNHDVERGTINAMVGSNQQHFKTLTQRVDLDEWIRKLSESSDQIDFVFRPLQNYQAFANKYGVSHLPNQPFYWQKDITVGSYTMRIRGVNSAIASNASDKEVTSPLFLGSVQSVLQRQAGVFYLFLCHHPADWLIDRAEVETDLKNRARIQLFGHKHTFKAEKVGDCLQLSAGAVHPSRREPGWQPRYNLLEIEAGDSKVSVNVWKRVWDRDSRRFKPDHRDKMDYDPYLLDMDDVEGKIATVETQVIIQTQSMEDAPDEVKIEVIDPQQPNPLRKLAYHFLSLSYSEKTLIAAELGLIAETDGNLSEVEISKAYFQRAEQQNLLSKLWNSVATKLPADSLGSNPFK